MTPKKIEYTGQLIGGPDEGNLVTSTVPHIDCWSITSLWLDGYRKRPDTQFIQGTYEWDEDKKYFKWVLKK